MLLFLFLFFAVLHGICHILCIWHKISLGAKQCLKAGEGPYMDEIKLLISNNTIIHILWTTSMIWTLQLCTSPKNLEFVWV